VHGFRFCTSALVKWYPRLSEKSQTHRKTYLNLNVATLPTVFYNAWQVT